MHMNEIETLQKEVQELKACIGQLQAANPLWGKKYVSCGDSFTSGNFEGESGENGPYDEKDPAIYDEQWQMNKTYPWWIARRNQMILINEAKGGSTMALTRGYLDGQEGKDITWRRPFSYQRYLQVPEDADYCTLWFGINDSVNTYLGTIDDTDNRTFYGAWNVVLEWLITNRPYTKLGIIVTNEADAAYRTAVRECALKWGVPYLDLMNDDRIPVMFERDEALGMCDKAKQLRRKQFIVTEDNQHPNLAAHKLFSYVIEEFLRHL